MFEDTLWHMYIDEETEHEDKVDQLIDDIQQAGQDVESIQYALNQFDGELRKSDLEKITRKTGVIIQK